MARHRKKIPRLRGQTVTEQTTSNVRPTVWGALTAALIGLAIFAAIPQREAVVEVAEPETIPQPAVEAETEAETAAAPLAPAEPEAVVVEVEDAAVEEPAPEIAEVAPPPAPMGPLFDTFRVDPKGEMVIAGRAEPGQVVDVLLAGQSIERVIADSMGNFVALPSAGPSTQPRRLSLVADPDGEAIESVTSYMVAPIAPPLIVVQVPEVPAEIAEPTEATAPEPPVITTAPATPPTVIEADAEGVRVVAASEPENVALDAITYDPEGEVQLSGRAIGDGSVQVYIDNEPLSTSPVTQGGDWQIELPQIDTGVYTLRIDEVDEEGGVVSRLETPFKREEPAEVAAVLAEETSVDGFEVAIKTVQPGATLWAIAEENFGSGIFYIEVFEANSDLIRDPDLIYPGQIFRMPEITE